MGIQDPRMASLAFLAAVLGTEAIRGRLLRPGGATSDGEVSMLTIHLTDPERILLLDALEAFVEASLSQHDPDAETAQQLIKRLQDVENIANDPAG
jgi:hypothetical protein